MHRAHLNHSAQGRDDDGLDDLEEGEGAHGEDDGAAYHAKEKLLHGTSDSHPSFGNQASAPSHRFGNAE